MSVVGPRTRMVYFRLSESEFQKLSSMCTGTEGARSVSELSRFAVQKLLRDAESSGGNGDGLAIREVGSKLNDLNIRLHEVIRLLGDNGENGNPSKKASSDE